MGIDLISVWKNIRGLIVLTFVLSIVTSVFTGGLYYLKTGDVQPLLEDTMGKLVAADNLAYQMEKDLAANTFESIPAEYRQFVKESLINKIISNITAQLIVMYVIFRFWKIFFEWNNSELGTKHTILEIIATLITYGALGIVYFVVTNIYLGNPLGAADTLLSALPFKSMVYGVKMLVASL